MDIRIIAMIVVAVLFIGATLFGFFGAHNKSYIRIGVVLVGLGTILPIVVAIILF